MPAIDRPTAAESREDYDINNPWIDPVNGGEWWFSPTKVRWHPVPAGGGASVSDTAYDATSWNGVTDEAPSKNAVRDKFESLPTVTVDAASIATAINAGTQDSTAADTDKLAVTHPAGGWMLLSTLWTWITGKLDTLAKLDTIVADATLARTDAGQTFAGAQVFTGSVSVTGGTTVAAATETAVALGTVTTTATLAITAGTLVTATLTASTDCTFAMPTVAAGKSFTLLLKQAATTGNGTATFTSVKWAGGTAPTITATAAKMDILTFVSDGTNWYGSIAQNFTP